jgi:hypothetical protein
MKLQLIDTAGHGDKTADFGRGAPAHVLIRTTSELKRLGDPFDALLLLAIALVI